MNWSSWLLWGFIANVAMTSLSTILQGVGLTRMNLPYMLGTIFTPSRDRAKLYGVLAHIGTGWLFSLVYVLVFQSLGRAGGWRGAIMGLAHAMFVLTVFMSLMPGLHPRMASEEHGPEAHNMLEPPGFLALNYGVQTPAVIILSHILFGVILGSFYRVQ